MANFSALICTYNRPDLLRISLPALIDKSIEKPDQVVIVNGGDERSDEIIRSFMGRPGIIVELVKTVNKNLATSRNIGLAHCTGEIVAMTDDDAEVFPDWVTQMKRVHAEHPEAGAVGGAVIGADSDKSLLSRIADVATFPSPSTPGYVRTLPGVNISYKRSILLQVGLQDETLFRGEDVDFNWRVIKAGSKVYYDPKIRVFHHHRPSFSKYLHQTYMYGRAYFLVRKKWPDMYGIYPRKIKTSRDFLKWGYFFVAILHQPLIDSLKLRSIHDRILGFPFLVLNQVSWRSGMLVQMLNSIKSLR